MRRESKRRTILAAIFALSLMGCILLSAQSGESINWQRYLAGRFMAETVQYATLPGATTTHAYLAALDANIRAIKYGSGISLSSLVARLSTVNGTAFGTPTVYDLRPYVMTAGWKFSWVDSKGKTAVAYGKARGTGETYTNLITGDNSTFASDTGWWTKNAGTGSVSITEGVARFVACQGGYGLFKSGLTMTGALYKGTFTVSGYSVGGVHFYFRGIKTVDKTANGAYSTYATARAVDNDNWIEATVTTTLDIDDVTVVQVLTPSALGLTMTSTPGGTTFNWASVEAGFNPNSLMTLNITKE